MAAAEGHVVVTFNGEIYNYRDLRADLADSGFTLRTGTDTEVLLYAYINWGVACLDRLVGMFAFAIFDAKERRLIFARDRAGEKPLFYRHDASGLALASELKALLELPDVERRVDHTSLAEYLTWGYVQGERCLLEGFRKLPPANHAVLDLTTNVLRIERYWQPPQRQIAPISSSDDLVEELDGLLAAAVTRQLVADVPVGVLLSGGLDSSLVAAYAARSTSRIRTFNVSFPMSAEHDESAHAWRVARHLGTDHTEIPLPEIGPDLLDALAVQVDEPIADPSLLPTAALSKVVREHVTVALGGDGGDELFGGYRQYVELARAERWRRHMPAFMRGRINVAMGHLPQSIRGGNSLRSLFDQPGSIGRYNVYCNASTRGALLRSFSVANTDCLELARDHLAPAGLPAGERASYADFLSYLPDEVMVKVDRASMLYSLETRAPFLDHHVVEFAFGRVPWSCKVDGSRRKILLRELARRHLPPDFDATRKQGFTPPLAAWFRSTLQSHLAEMVDHLASVCFDHSTLSAMAARPERHANRLFLLVMLSKWLVTYRVRL